MDINEKKEIERKIINIYPWASKYAKYQGLQSEDDDSGTKTNYKCLNVTLGSYDKETKSFKIADIDSVLKEFKAILEFQLSFYQKHGINRRDLENEAKWILPTLCGRATIGGEIIFYRMEHMKQGIIVYLHREENNKYSVEKVKLKL